MQRITTIITLIALFVMAIALVGEAIQLVIIAAVIAASVFLLSKGLGDDR